VVPRHGWRHSSPEFGHSGGGFGRGRGGEGRGAHHRPVCGLRRVGNAGRWPAGGAQGARPRQPPIRRCSGLGVGAVGAGRLGRPCGTARRHWTAAKCARGGGAREWAHGQDAGVQRSAVPPVRGPAGALPL
jgi:hypothetical protein